VSSMTAERYLAILGLLRRGGPLTRRELAERTGVSASQLSHLTAELLDLELIREDGKAQSSGGRPSDLLTLNAQAGFVVGLDIGGTRQRAVVADMGGGVAHHLTEPTPLSSDRGAIVGHIEQLIDRTIREAGITRDAVHGVGVGLRGIVDSSAGVVYGWPNTPAWSDAWNNFPIRAALAERLPWRQIVIEDTVRAIGIAEAAYGHGAEAGAGQDFVYVLAGTGIGAALMIGGSPYRGPNHVAGEIGHVRITDAPIACQCGNVGCLETVASGPAIVAQARRRLAESHILTALRDAEELTAALVIAEGEREDRLAYQVLTEAGEFFGRGLALLLNLLGARLIVVGGPLASSTPFLDAARRTMRLTALPHASRQVVVARSRLDDLGGARGAATLALDALFGAAEPNILTLSGAPR
jgi:N-acetylglucosamine repressor